MLKANADDNDYHVIPSFQYSKEESFEDKLEKEKSAGDQHFLFFFPKWFLL